MAKGDKKDASDQKYMKKFKLRSSQRNGYQNNKEQLLPVQLILIYYKIES